MGEASHRGLLLVLTRTVRCSDGNMRFSGKFLDTDTCPALGSSDAENWRGGGDGTSHNTSLQTSVVSSAEGQVTCLARPFLTTPHQMQNALRKTSEYQITAQ